MNQRIKELASQCWDLRLDGRHFDQEQFAELIVKECSKVIRHGGQRKGAFGNEDLRPSEIATMIEEHFGVCNDDT